MTTGGTVNGGVNKQPTTEEELAQIKEMLGQYGQGAEENRRIVQKMNQRGPGYRAVERSAQERAAGVSVPGYEGVRDVMTGDLLDQYRSDPYQGEALQKLKEQAFAEGDSPWAKMQLEKQGLEEGDLRDQASKSQAQAMAQAQSQMMRQGGLSGGARERMASQGAKDMMLARQGAARQGMMDRLNIQDQDMGRKTDLLKSFGDAESASNQQNIARTMGDVEKSTMFDLERYKQQMAAYGAKESAEAQRAAAGGGGKK